MNATFQDALMNWLIVSLVTFNVASGFFTFFSRRHNSSTSILTFVSAILLAAYSLMIASIPLGLYKMNIDFFLFGFVPLTFLGPVLYLLVDGYLATSNGISLWTILPGFTGLIFFITTMFHSDAEMLGFVQGYAESNFLKGQRPDLWLAVSFGTVLSGQFAFFFISFVRTINAHFKKQLVEGSRILILLILTAGPIVIYVCDILIMMFDIKIGSTTIIICCTPLYALVIYRNSLMDRDYHLQLERQREEMMRYLPEQLVQQLQSNRSALMLRGERGIGTVMFCDIRNFTSIAESLDPMQVTTILNEYFAEMNKIIFRHGGTINKYIGDAIMVVFGLLDREQDQADVSVRCALEMFQQLAILNLTWQASGRPEIRIGIGVHRGPLIHGNVGSSNRMEYTVIGDTVNTAARIAGLNSKLGEPLLISSVVIEHVAELIPGLYKLGDFDLKGKNKKVTLFGLHLDHVATPRDTGPRPMVLSFDGQR